jgi:hypothetical protein
MEAVIGRIDLIDIPGVDHARIGGTRYRQSGLRVSIRHTGTLVSIAGKNGLPPPTRTGDMTRRSSSICPSHAGLEASRRRWHPGRPGSRFNRFISAAMSPRTGVQLSGRADSEPLHSFLMVSAFSFRRSFRRLLQRFSVVPGVGTVSRYFSVSRALSGSCIQERKGLHRSGR